MVSLSQQTVQKQPSLLCRHNAWWSQRIYFPMCGGGALKQWRHLAGTDMLNYLGKCLEISFFCNKSQKLKTGTSVQGSAVFPGGVGTAALKRKTSPTKHLSSLRDWGFRFGGVGNLPSAFIAKYEEVQVKAVSALGGGAAGSTFLEVALQDRGPSVSRSCSTL